jgi:hypothetical protein
MRQKPQTKPPQCELWARLWAAKKGDLAIALLYMAPDAGLEPATR